MPAGLSESIQGAPKWMQEYIENLIQKSRQLSSERYLPYGQVSPEQNQVIRAEMEKLSAKQKGNVEQDIIPFSVTGTSKPVNISPIDLRHIIDDEGYARRVYEHTTGNHYVTKDQIEELRRRANTQFQTFLPEIQKLDQHNKEKQRRAREIEEPLAPLQEELSGLEGKRRSIAGEIESIEQFSSPQELENPQLQLKLKGLKESLVPIERQFKAKSKQAQELQRNLAIVKPPIHASPLVEDLFSRVSAEREANNLQRQRGQIAPMNEYHEQAINMLKRSFDDDTMKLAGHELGEARKHNELRAVEPLIKSSLEDPSRDYVNNYVDDYTNDYTNSMRKALSAESEREWLENISPKISAMFDREGKFTNGSRDRLLRKHYNDHRTKLEEQVNRLTAEARKDARRDAIVNHQFQQKLRQSAASQIGETTHRENETHRQNAEALRHQSVTNQAANQLNVSALGQVARAKQEQEQHEIDVQRQEHQRQLLYPQEQLAREAAMLSGLPPQASQTLVGSLAASPPPPNLFTLGAGALGALAGGFNAQSPQQQRMYKKGGSVRKRYANGGPVGSDEIGNEIRKIIQEQGHGDKSRMEHVSHYNPLQSWLKHVGNEMLTNPGEDTLLSLGRGSAAAMEHADVVKERAANLHDKIQNTKLSQYKVLAEYENMKEHSALQRAQLGETKRGHDLLYQMRGSSLNQKQMAKPISASERKAEIDAKKDLMRAIRMKKEVNHIGDLIKKTSTGPVIGGIKSILPKTKIDNQIEVGTNKLILDMHQGMKNIPRSEEFMKRVESTKPNRSNYAEANEDSLNLMRQGANDVEEHSISTLLSMGWTPEKIEKQFKVKVPEHMLGESVHEMPEEEAQQEEQSYGDIVQMIDPGGNPLEVPADQVEEALSRGAIIAQ